MNEATGGVTHLMVAARDCAGPLENIQALTKACVDAINGVELQIVAETQFAFTPHGATVVLLLAQSHLVVSTWPEHRLVIVDVTICGSKATASKLWRGIKSVLEPESSEISEQHIALTFPRS
ncbi:MAG: S-adenosylmethionine decarboxylase family protein [Egibacteraceae bacterium]